MVSLKKPAKKKKTTATKAAPETTRPTIAKLRHPARDVGWVPAAERIALAAARKAERDKVYAEAQAEADAALARFEAEPKAEYALHLHHERLVEKIDEGGGVRGARTRIGYVLSGKDLDELVPRLRAMRPIPSDKVATAPTADLAALDAAAAAARDKYNAAHQVLNKASEDRRAATEEASGEKARNAVKVALPKFLAEGWYGYDPKKRPKPTKEQLDVLVSSATEYFEKRTDPKVEARLKELDAKYDAAAKAVDLVARELSKAQEASYRARSKPDSPISEAKAWSLHKELCLKDCPYTKAHPSVIPPAIESLT